MQELRDSIKRPNLRIMGTEEGEEVQNKGYVTYSKNSNRKFPKSQESFTHSGTESLKDTSLIKIEPPHSILSSKQQA
jgi:hypothetical protein